LLKSLVRYVAKLSDCRDDLGVKYVRGIHIATTSTGRTFQRRRPDEFEKACQFDDTVRHRVFAGRVRFGAQRLRSEPREPARILELLSSPATLAAAIRAAAPSHDSMAQRWLVELDSPSATIREAFGTFGERFGSLLDSPAGRSLGTGSDALRLDDVLATNGKLLISLDPRYGPLSRKIGAWTLVAMLRLAAELRTARWQGRCLFVIDEPRLLGHEGRHLADLFGTARDAGVGLVVADQGIAGLAAVHPDLPDAVMVAMIDGLAAGHAPGLAGRRGEDGRAVRAPNGQRRQSGRLLDRPGGRWTRSPTAIGRQSASMPSAHPMQGELEQVLADDLSSSPVLVTELRSWSPNRVTASPYTLVLWKVRGKRACKI
jgi:hypothetical protein